MRPMPARRLEDKIRALCIRLLASSDGDFNPTFAELQVANQRTHTANPEQDICSRSRLARIPARHTTKMGSVKIQSCPFRRQNF
jgi:hypothetical protein